MPPNSQALDNEGGKMPTPFTQAQGKLDRAPPKDENELQSEDSFCELQGECDNLTQDVPCKVSDEADDVAGRTGRRRTSRFCGVCSANRKNQWQARILMQNKVTHLGYFNTEEEAARIYDVVSLSLHEDKANINFPLSDYTSSEHAERLRKLSGLSRQDLQKALGVKPIRKTSRFNGVSKKRGKWVAKVMIDKKLVYHASFHDEREAALAYDAAVRRLKPSRAHAYVNFVEQGPADVGRKAISKGSIPPMQMGSGPFQQQQFMSSQHHGMAAVPESGRSTVPIMPQGSTQLPNNMYLPWPMMGHMPFHNPMESHIPQDSDRYQVMMPSSGMAAGQPRLSHSSSMPYPPDMLDMNTCATSAEMAGHPFNGFQAGELSSGPNPTSDWWRNHPSAFGGGPASSIPPHMVGSSQGYQRPSYSSLAPPQHPIMWDPMMKGMAPPFPILQHNNPMDAVSRREPLRAHVQSLMQPPHGMMGSMYERESSSASTWTPFPGPDMGGLYGEDNAFKRNPAPTMGVL